MVVLSIKILDLPIILRLMVYNIVNVIIPESSLLICAKQYSDAVNKPANPPPIIDNNIAVTGLKPESNKIAKIAPPVVKLPSIVKSANPNSRKEIIIPRTKRLNIIPNSITPQ